jgi:undecaprenyl diphosphate synthase
MRNSASRIGDLFLLTALSKNMTQHELPYSIGIIMDGNRRWAKERGLPTFEGHRKGYDKLTEVLDWCREMGVKELTVFAFSTENWNRTQEEVGYLMDLFRTMIATVERDAIANDTRLIFLGERSRFSSDILTAIEHAEAVTASCASFRFGIALSYGGRAEIVDAIHRIPPEHLPDITEEEFAALLWSHELRDPDLIIRTSGEQRLSGFLTWGSVYSELAFTDTYWPAFTKEEFTTMLADYAARGRRFGK